MSAWRAEAQGLTPVESGAELPVMIAQAASWAERITCCVTAPHSERGALPWWRDLLSRCSKCDAVYVRQSERAEGWLLHRLHAAGVLRLVDIAEPPLAHELWLFARGNERRVLLAHVPLERAVSRAAVGALLSFQGGADSELGRECQAQANAWGKIARIPAGREVDVLALDPRRNRPRPPLDLPSPLRVVSEHTALGACLERFTGQARSAPAFDLHPWRVSAFTGGYRLSLVRGPDARFNFTLYAGASVGAGNALLLDDGAGQALLAWRGDLLGPSRSRSALLWSEARLASFVLGDRSSELSPRVAVVARSSAPLGPQLAAFDDELQRLSAVFGVEPPPALGHVLADFASLGPRQQTLLVWRALIGMGALPLDTAAGLAAESLRAHGYLRGPSPEPGAAPHRALVELLRNAAEHGRNFDHPGAAPGARDSVRAIQPDASAYVLDDWLECLLLALPQNEVVPRGAALRLGFERACHRFGLAGARLRRDGAIERALESAVATALCRGLLIRVGAAGLQRLTTESPPPEPPPGALVANATEARFISGWTRALAGLDPLHRFVLTRRSGEHAAREPLSSVATRLGLTLERARQLELEAWQRVSASSGWARALRARLERALAGAASVPVRRLLNDDAWWQGLDQRPELADAVFEGLLGARLHRVELALPERELLIARFNQAALDETLRGLMDVAARLRTPTGIDAYHRLADAAARELDASLAEPFRAALEACLELDPGGSLRVIGFARRLPEPAALDAHEAAGAHDVFGGHEVPGGAEVIARISNDVTEALEARRRPLEIEAAWALVQARAQQAWSPELMLQVFASDPALRVSATHATSLRSWEGDPTRNGARLCPGVPPGARPRLEQLLQQAPPSPEVLARQLKVELERLDRTDFEELQVSSTARQLADLALRWLGQTGDEAPETWSSMLAAVQMILDAIAPDEADVEAPPLAREAVYQAREVLAAELRERGLPWLEDVGGA